MARGAGRRRESSRGPLCVPHTRTHTLHAGKNNTKKSRGCLRAASAQGSRRGRNETSPWTRKRVYPCVAVDVGFQVAPVHVVCLVRPRLRVPVIRVAEHGHGSWSAGEPRGRLPRPPAQNFRKRAGVAARAPVRVRRHARIVGRVDGRAVARVRAADSDLRGTHAVGRTAPPHCFGIPHAFSRPAGAAGAATGTGAETEGADPSAGGAPRHGRAPR